jgi:hypothetical protein
MRSMPMSAMWIGGMVVTMRPLPSLVTRQMPPVSATPKLTPLMPISAVRKTSRKHFASGGGECGNVFSVGDAELFVKELCDLFFFQMRRRRDDVTRLLAAQLHDVFAEVGFDDLIPCFSSAWLSSISSLTMLLDLATKPFHREARQEPRRFLFGFLCDSSRPSR